jgi:tRNA-binding protein
MAKPEKRITFEDFLKVDIRVGKIVQAEFYPEARRPAYKVWVDFGDEIGVLKSSAQITVNYLVDELPGLLVAGVVNFPEKQIGKFMSEFLLLGFPDENGAVVLLQPSKHVPLGGRLF